jgi:hypothetical protein
MRKEIEYTSCVSYYSANVDTERHKNNIKHDAGKCINKKEKNTLFVCGIHYVGKEEREEGGIHDFTRRRHCTNEKRKNIYDGTRRWYHTLPYE